jgi:hypothetical protein
MLNQSTQTEEAHIPSKHNKKRHSTFIVTSSLLKEKAEQRRDNVRLNAKQQQERTIVPACLQPIQ